MPAFQWDQQYVTHLTSVDEQHHHLVDIINQFAELLGQNTVADQDIETLFHELVAYAKYHFNEEEALMVSAGLDPRHINAHIQAHEHFISEISLLHASVSPENPDVAHSLLGFLTHWLAFHILVKDQNMARQMGAIKAGTPADIAYEHEEVASSDATEPLVKALNGLFLLVSERNRELFMLNQSLEEKVQQRTLELTLANEKLEALSNTDLLTGLPNRRFALMQLRNAWDAGKSLVCMMVDADHFKEVNDTYGHDAGDFVLKRLALEIRDSLRNDDIVCRIGGDEFLILCSDTDKKGGMQLAEKLRLQVSRLQVPTGGVPWYGSISIGVAARTPDMTNSEDLIKFADESLYLAKQAGKNCVRTMQ